MSTEVAVSQRVHPIRDQIVVRRDSAQDRTEAGIIIPEQAKDQPTTGLVVEVGPGKVCTLSGVLLPMTVKKDDRVMFSNYAGAKITVNDETLLVMTEEEVLCVVTEDGASDGATQV